MCDTARRCDRPSCPCNEPDTELKDALTRMQERFPVADGWSDHEVCDCEDGTWVAIVLKNTSGTHMGIDGSGPTPHAAVDAAINAWGAAVKADALFAVLKAECEAWRAWELSPSRTFKQLNELKAARAATDKAGALR